MTKNSPTEPSGRKRQWFARRQVYLRTGQDSQYVELSPVLQIGVALGFGALALWLVGASYGAVNGFLESDEQAALRAQLDETQQALAGVAQERDDALRDVARIADLETALVDARAAAQAPRETADNALALQTELEQARGQLEELRLRLSEAKADHAALQAKYEAELLATTDAGEKTAEEASNLHAQLEEAFGEIETLQKQRDDATAQLAALNEQTAAREETTERNSALLKAATAEIERLQETMALAKTEAQEKTASFQTTIDELEGELAETRAARDELEQEVAALGAEGEQAGTAVPQAAPTATVSDQAVEVAFDAELQARSIAADLKEADLLATIDDLRAELAATPAPRPATPSESETAETDSDEMRALRERVAVAEAEIERLILKGLTDEGEPVATSIPAEADAEASDDPGETERLRAELLAARADIIKLNADVRAARQRLADQAETENGAASKPDNSAKLEQQLASTRSRVQQLNKALADAKLREVAIDLALINVVPSPSPPAPR